MRPPRVVLAAIALLSALLVPAAASPAADTLTVDFETGPALGTPVNDDYLASAFTRFLSADAGFRPYRRSAPGQARSGTVAADVGADVCLAEFGGGNGCEFFEPSSTGRLTRTASAVTVHAGLFSGGGTVSAKLTAYRANNTLIGSGAAVPISAAGFTTPVTVTSPSADIARFLLTSEGPGATGATLGFDDLVVTFPDSSLPDVSVGAPTDIRTVLQNQTTDIPIDLTRLNASNGPVDLSVTGLPPDVYATFDPDPVPGTQQTAMLHLTAFETAVPSFVPTQLTITADPSGNASVAPAPRTATLSIVVKANFDAATDGGTENVLIPQCAPGELGLRVQRDIAFAGTVTLAATGLPAGVTAEFLPSATIPPGGNLIAERTLRLRRGSRAIPTGSAFEVRASAPGAPGRTLSLRAYNAVPTATATTGLGGTPRRGLPGTEIRVEGNGFCPGTTVDVGNRRAVADTQVGADERSLTFRIPRAGTTGPLTFRPPAGQAFTSSAPLVVRSFRNAEGFAFRNYGYDYLSFGELTDLVGIKEMFVAVNVCWPLGNCPVPTGIPDPVAFATWGILNISLRLSGGHCFGMSRTVQELLAGKVKYRQFAGDASAPFELPSATGPGGALNDWLDARHAGQGTLEFLSAYVGRARTIGGQLGRVRSELAAGRYPGISLKNGVFEGHVVTAYDVEDQPDGSIKIYVYDNNRPFTADELTDADRHADRELVESVIRILPGGSSWEFDTGDGVWSGGGGDWFAIPLSVIPDDPSLPGINGLSQMTVFGSAGAAAKLNGIPKGAEYVPAQDDNGVPGAAGFVVAPRAAGPVTNHVEGTRAGTYSQSIAGSGFVGKVTDVATGPGVSDALTARTRDGALAFAGERERPLRLDLAVRGGDVHRGASIETRTFKGGEERAAIGDGGALRYRHRGAATAFSFELTSATRNAGAAHFSSGPLRIASGDQVRATPLDWATLGRVRLDVLRTNGSRSTRVLVNRARTRTRIALSRPSVKRTRRGRVASVRLRVRRPAAIASAGVVLRLLRDGRVVAHRAVGLRHPGRGRSISWRLPRLAKGAYTLRADARLLVGGTAPAALREGRAAGVRLR